jgi:hypothetical protein
MAHGGTSTSVESTVPIGAVREALMSYLRIGGELGRAAQAHTRVRHHSSVADSVLGLSFWMKFAVPVAKLEFTEDADRTTGRNT